MSRGKGIIHSHTTPTKQYSHEINYYGLHTPVSQRKTLIDQIINNCQKIQSPKHQLIHKNVNPCLNNSAKPILMSDKENYRKIDTYTPFDNIQSKRRSSNTKSSSVCKRLFDDASKHIPLQQCKRNLSKNEQYFNHNLAAKNTPGKIHDHQRIIRKSPNFQKKYLLKMDIEKQKEEHLQHCQREEKKLKIYFLQLEKKLNEVKNQQFKTLQEYQRSKLIQLNDLLKQNERIKDEKQVEGIESKFTEITGHDGLMVDEDQRIEMRGCLRTGLNAMKFSFNQCLR